MINKELIVMETEQQYHACARLMMGILQRALDDICEGSYSTRNQRRCQKALEWIFSSRDFDNICFYAGLNADQIREGVIRFELNRKYFFEKNLLRFAK